MLCILVRLTFAYASNKYCILHTGVVKEQVMFNSSMSEEEFFKWLKSRGISDKDCKALSGMC